MATGKRGAQAQIALAERRVQALAMRRAGASYRAIGDRLGVSYQAAFEDVRYGLAELAADLRVETEQLRALEASRLDALQAAIWQNAMTGNLKAIQTVLRISERRARLLGLDIQPGAELPAELDIILRWHDDNRRIIDVTPPAHDHPAAPASLTGDSGEAPEQVSYRVRWQTLGQEPTSGDALPENRD